MSEEKGCWNCRWENLEGDLEPCLNCSLYDKWEEKTHDQEG